MNETMLRWSARLGSLKPVVGIALVFAVLVSYRESVHLGIALNNRDAPQTVALMQLVNGDVGIGRYVTISGLAAYDLGYEKTADGKTTAIYYFLIDPDDGAMVLIRHSATQLAVQQDGSATITGMTRATSADLQAAVGQDAKLFAARGWRATTQFYVEDGAFPPDIVSSALLLLASVIVAGGCVYVLFSPRYVFTFYPSDTTTPLAERPRMKATGVFTQLNRVEPLDMGKRTQKFTDAIANLILLGDHEALIYIRYVLQTKTYWITAHTTATDWGVYLHSDQDVVVSSGKLLGWKDKWAVRVQYSTARGKPATLYLVFEDAGAQAACVELLRARRFTMRKRLKKFATTPG